MSPAGTTRQTPSRKLHSSPTPPVVEKNTLMTFFTRHTATPLTGPRLKAARRAGSSEKSIFTKDGIRKGMGKDRNMRMAAAALRMAVTASLWVLTVWDIKTLLHGYSTPEDDPSPEYCPRKSAAIFFHPDCHCRYRIHTGSTLARSRTEARGHHRRWGLAPRPEDERFGRLPPLYAKSVKGEGI